MTTGSILGYSTLLIAVLANTLIGLLVYTKGRKSRASKPFLLMSLCITGWVLDIFGLMVAPNYAFALLWSSYFQIGMFFIAPTYLKWVFSLTGETKFELWLVRISTVLACSTFLSFIPALRPALLTYSWGYWPSASSPMYLILSLNTAASLTYGLGAIMKKYQRATSAIEKNQFRYLLLGVSIAVVTGLYSFLPNFGIDVYPLGPLGQTLYLSIVAYAIVQHQLMDIEVVIKRTLVFAGLAGSVVAVVALMAFVTQDVLARFVATPRWFSNVLAAVVIAGVYGPLRNWLVNITDRFLFQKKYDYKELLKKFTDDVMTIVDLKQLIQTTVTTLVETVKLDNCSLLLLNKDSHTYEPAASRGTNGRRLALDEQEPFIRFFRETHEPIGLDGTLGQVRFPEAVTGRLQELHARLCLPLHLHEDLIGVLCLGKKKSDEEFTKDDLDILLPLARTLAISVSNAQLFSELAKTQAEAAQKEKLAVIGTLSAGINHEICNPLGIIKAQCEAFLMDLEDGILIGKSPSDLLNRTSSILQVALKQIDRATAITQKLSNFAKPIKDPSSQPVSVEQEVGEVLLLVGHDLTLEKIAFESEFPPDLPSITVDRRQFQEVLFNLIRNAAQAITPPGTIRVRARAHEDGRVRIEIEDTGSGIAPDKLGKIYDPFFTTKEPGKGTGLGLFIVRQIVERNRGRITVESVVGKGTTFFLDFPSAAEARTMAR